MARVKLGGVSIILREMLLEVQFFISQLSLLFYIIGYQH